jgi:Glycosyl transferases group 1
VPQSALSAVDQPGVKPDVIVAWLQNDYGQLGRPAEAIAHALVDHGIARRVAYVEPFAHGDGEPTLERNVVRGLEVYNGHGGAIRPGELAQAVIGASQLSDPILLNFGVGEANWSFLHEFRPHCSRAVLVTHDRLSEWDAFAARRTELERIRTALIGASDLVLGLSHGSIEDVEDAEYVGHGCDDAWTRPGVDDAAEPTDLAAIPHPRAIYVGALSVRVEAEALRALAQSGVHVVLVGFAPSPAVQAAIDSEPNVHFLGPRAPDQTPAYLLHSDVGIIPHTDEPFTYSMEPHKAYNYACAGLHTVTLNVAHAPALEGWLTQTGDVESFVAAVHAAPRLDRTETEAAREITWASVAEKVVQAALGVTTTRY